MTLPGDDENGRLVELLESRFDCLERLTEERLHKPGLVDCLDVSRSTVDRAVRRLEDAGYVRRTDEGYTATLTGRRAVESHRVHRQNIADLAASANVLAPLTPDSAVDLDVIAHSESIEATEPTPYEPRERIAADLRGADRCRIALPALPDPKLARLLYERVVTDGCRVELLVSDSLLDRLREEFPLKLPMIADRDVVTVRTGAVPEYGLVFTDGPDGPCVSVLVFGSGGALHGILRNDTEQAITWVRRRFDAVVADATDVTDALSADGKDRSEHREMSTPSESPELTVPTSSTSRELPVSLESQGFVRLTPWFFANRSPRDPMMAWRTGLGLSEVQAGYAVERGADVDGQRRDLHRSVLDRLREGSHCAVIGPPGSGKSTLCKQVACGWYRDGDPVYYRESGRGRAFDAVDALSTAVREAEGMPLVVVEDAVRSEANAVFDALSEFDGDAVVLLDAREDEWHYSPVGFDPDLAAERSGVETVTMPPLSEGDYVRLVDQFEKVVDEPVDVPVDRLRARVRDESLSDDEAAPSEVLLLLHRLALYADRHEATTLEADVADLYDDLVAAGPIATDVGLLANLLNAAGIEPHESYLRTVTAGEGAGDVEDAVDRLEGRVLFERDTGGYRRVHEEWSVAFLCHFLDAEGADAAAERTCRLLGTLLALADDPDLRERLRRACRHDATALQSIAESPADWAANVTEQVFSFVEQRRPNLTPLLGRVEGPEVAFPTAIPPETRFRCLYSRGIGCKNTGLLDRAENEFRRMVDSIAADDVISERERTELRALALAGVGEVATNRGDYDDAEDRMREALELYRCIDDRYGQAHCLDRLARIAGERGDFDRLDRYCDDAAAIADELGATRIRCRLQNSRGLAAWTRGDLEAAESYFLDSLEHGRSMDSRQDEAFALGNLGLVARERGAFDDAQRYFERALSLRRELEVRPDIALTRWNLGEVARRRGNLAAAADHLRTALDLYRDIGDEVWIARCRVVLGEIAFDRGDFDVAAGHAETAVDTLEGAEEALDRASALLLLAGVERERGEIPAAETRLETARELCDRAESYQGRIWCLTERGRIDRDRGAFDAAEERLGRALKLARENDYAYDEAIALEALGSLEMARELPEAAQSYLERAVARHRECGAERNALEAVDSLVEACELAGDASAAERWAATVAGLRDTHDAGESPAGG